MFWIVLANIPLFAILGFTTGSPLILFSILLGVVHFSVQPIGNALIAGFTDSKNRGLWYGVSFFFSFGVGSLAAGIGGWVAEQYSVSMVFPMVAILLLPGLWIAFRFRKFQPA